MISEHWQHRTKLLIGEDGIKILAGAHVLVVGLGGVGSWCAELLCRAGIGSLTVVDGDKVNVTNRNRQLAALVSTEGEKKSHVIGQRLLDINPDIKLTVIDKYLKDDDLTEVITKAKYSYIVDAIDTLAPKIHLIRQAIENDIPLVSSLGSGGKTDPMQVKIDDIDKSYNCRLAAILRKRLHQIGIRTGFKVVYSSQQSDKSAVIEVNGEPNKKSTVGTISFMPPLFGCMCASVVIKDLLKF